MLETEPRDTPASVALKRAIDFFGTQAKLAEKAGVNQQLISRALANKWVSAELAVAIEKASGGEIKRVEFRPDLFEREGAR